MEERVLIAVNGQVMIYDPSAQQWHPAGTSSGLSTVRLIHYVPSNTFMIQGQKIDELKEVVLESQITREVKYNRNESFIQWHDSQAYWGLNFGKKNLPAAQKFFESLVSVLRVLNQNAAQPQPPCIPPELINNVTQQQQQQPSQQNSVPKHLQTLTIQQQQSILQQQQQQHQHQQQQQQQQHQPAHMMGQQQAQSKIITQVAAPNQMIQQQLPSQLQLLQQQQQLQQYMSQQQMPPQALSHQVNQNQMNHYQHHHAPQQQTQQQQHIQQQQVAPVATAPVPPPPPPPPAPPALIQNAPRTNGTNGKTQANNVSSAPANNGNNLQHSPITSSSSGSDNNTNGGSPNQVSSLASELAKCQLRKVNLPRSESEKESECNNNVIANAKTTRAASLAYPPDNLMNDLNRKLASRRERIDQQGEGQSGPSNNETSSQNGSNINGDKESWIADLIRKEITKMKAEVIDAIKMELRQR